LFSEQTAADVDRIFLLALRSVDPPHLQSGNALFWYWMNTLVTGQIRCSYFSTGLMQRSENLMRSFNLAVIVGSLRREFFKRQLLNGLAPLPPAECSFVHLNSGGLILDHQYRGVNSEEVLTGLKAAIIAALGLSFSTTEYERSIPGVLKTAIDRTSRPFCQSGWTEKGAGILGAAMAQHHLRQILASLFVQTKGQSEVFVDTQKSLIDGAGPVGDGSKLLLQAWMDRHVAWVNRRVG
jgi:chromate reductase